MNEVEALEYAAKILKADQENSYYPGVYHEVAIAALDHTAQTPHRRARLEAAIRFNEENEGE